MPEPAQSLVAHQSWLRRLARRLVRSESAAEDLVQETCVTALCKAPPDAHLRPWLRGVMRNLAMHHVRSERRRVLREERFQNAGPASAVPDSRLEYGVDRERLLEVVEALPEPFRSTVVQRFLEGLSCAEIARSEGVPAGTVRWRQSRALELLRRRLEGSGKRRRLLGWLPFGGVGSHLVTARLRDRLLSGKSGAIAIALASLAVVIGIGVRDEAPGNEPRARRIGAASATASGAIGVEAVDRETAHAAVIGWSGQPRLMRWDAAQAGLLSRRAQRETRARLERRRQLERLREQYELAFYDCETDRDSVLRCRREPVDPDAAGGAICVVLLESVAAIEQASDRRAASAHTKSFLAAATRANRALAHRLGCALAVDPEDAPVATGSGRSDDAGETLCQGHPGPEGEECSTCTDESGLVRTVCAPVHCESTTDQNGATCTRCTDANGRVETTCTGGEWPTDCTSVLQAHGVVCSTCPGDGDEAPECLVAECNVVGPCLECIDPKGRVGTDCSIDYGALSLASASVGGGGTFNVCMAIWGFPDGATGNCHYPGNQSCIYRESGVARCIDCTYRDGSGGSRCLLDASDPLPEVMAGRPSSLPPPGQCVTETSADGLVECSTCTRYDLSATRSCRLPPAEWCETAPGKQPGEKCAVCRLEEGGVAQLCDSAGS
jgi:RNA polymerase sigma-70 factor, ECF subfamily